MGFEQELKIVARAYNQAGQGLKSTAQGIEEVAKSALNAAAGAAKLNQAFGQAVAQAEGFKRASTGLYLPLDRVAEAEQRVAQQSNQMGQATGQAAQQMQGMGGHTGRTRDAMQDLYQTLGMLGFLYGFQRAVAGIIGVTREFGKEITQASIISEDFTGTLQRQAMAATQGIFGPKELADVYRDLGSAGLNANRVLAATPNVLNFATAAMVEQSDAAQAVIAAASSFRIPFEQSEKITDAFAEAMNRTTLGGRDLVYALASIGPVAGMANQGLGETLAAVAALRNAGAHAQDAATSVRAAMLHLSAPSEEAKDIIKQLGISIFDASGNMKQWSAIVAEFERALGPYDQKTKNMVLTTVLGTDGIRAMASAMQMGSGKLADLAQSFENAEGSAARMAAQMGETLDGAMRRLAGNTERAALAIGGDLEPALISLLGFLNTLAVGFANLDAGTRRAVEGLIGTAGLLGAGMSVVGMAKMLLSALSNLGPVLNATSVAAGATAITLGSVVSIVGAVALAVGLGYGAWRAYQAGQEQAALAGADQAEQLRSQADRVRDLTAELETLAAKTSPTADEQERLKAITGEIARLAPEAALGINQMTGRVIDLGQVLEGTNTAMARMMSQSKVLAEGAATAAKAKLPAAKTELSNLEESTRFWTDAASGKHSTQELRQRMFDEGSGRFSVHPGTASDAGLRKAAGKRLSELINQLAEKQAEVAELEAIAARAAALAAPADSAASSGGIDDLDILRAEQRQRRNLEREAKGIYGTSLFGGGDKEPTWISQWKAGLQETMDVLSPFKSGLSDVSSALDLLGAKQSAYLSMIRDGRAGVEAAQAVELTRVQTLAKLAEHQEALHKANQAYMTMVTALEGKQGDLDAQFASGAITAADHAEASRALRTETDRLTQAVGQNSAAWWKDEQAIAAAESAAGDAEATLRQVREHLNDQAYQLATGQMKHEVAMKRLSVDQQITLVRQMRKEMNLSAQQSVALQEQLVGLWGQKVRIEADRIQEAYQDSLDGIDDSLQTKLDNIESRLEKTLAPLKQALKELEEEERGTDRTRAQEDHERKLADLREKRQHHEKRIGLDHKKALAELDDQIADENREWQRKQDDWNLDDRKRAKGDEIKAAEDGAEKERKHAQADAKKQRDDLQDHYREVKRLTEKGILETIATLAATNPQWFDTGKGMIGELIKGLQTGDFTSVLNQINSVKSAADQAARAAENSVATSRQSLIQQLNDQVDKLHADWFNASGAESQSHIHDQAEALRQQILDLGGKVRTPAYASGAWEIPGTQLAMLHQEEAVLPAPAAEAFRQFAPAVSNLDRVIEGAVDRLIKAVQTLPRGPVTVYGAQNAYLEDPVDVDMLGRQTARQVDRLTPTGG